MEKQKKKHVFTITHHGHKIILESESKRPEALKALLNAAFFGFRATHPDKLDMLMRGYNTLYDTAIKEVAAKEAKKLGLRLPADDEPEPIDDFYFWKELMEARWY